MAKNQHSVRVPASAKSLFGACALLLVGPSISEAAAPDPTYEVVLSVAGNPKQIVVARGEGEGSRARKPRRQARKRIFQCWKSWSEHDFGHRFDEPGEAWSLRDNCDGVHAQTDHWPSFHELSDTAKSICDGQGFGELELSIRVNRQTRKTGWQVFCGISKPGTQLSDARHYPVKKLVAPTGESKTRTAAQEAEKQDPRFEESHTGSRTSRR